MDVFGICVLGVDECQESTMGWCILVVCIWLRGIMCVIKEECVVGKEFV